MFFFFLSQRINNTCEYDMWQWHSYLSDKMCNLLQASAEKKPVGSTSGMQTSVQTSCLLKVTPPILLSAYK